MFSAENRLVARETRDAVPTADIQFGGRET